jgi:hypothetical protein
MDQTSAAARGVVLAGSALLMAALALAVVPAAAARTDAGYARAQAPPQKIGTRGVRLAAPVNSLASDGNRVAYAFCRQLVAWWQPGTHHGSKLGPPANFTCPAQTSPFLIYSLAFSGNRIAWAENFGGIQTNSYIRLALRSQPATIDIVATQYACCRADPLGEGRMGFVVGQGGVIGFSRWELCGDLGAPACPTGPKTFVDSFVYRVLQPTGSGTACPGSSWPCPQIATANGLLGPISSHSGRFALRYDTGVIRVVDRNGANVRLFPALAGMTRAAELWRKHLLVLVNAKVIDFSIVTGAQLHMRSVAAVPSGGPCFRLPCPTPTLRLEDFARGLVAYTLQGKIHVLRLSDGHDRVVANGTTSRFVTSGLVYAYEATGAYPAGLRWVTNARLAQILA